MNKLFFRFISLLLVGGLTTTQSLVAGGRGKSSPHLQRRMPRIAGRSAPHHSVARTPHVTRSKPSGPRVATARVSPKANKVRVKTHHTSKPKASKARVTTKPRTSAKQTTKPHAPKGRAKLKQPSSSKPLTAKTSTTTGSKPATKPATSTAASPAGVTKPATAAVTVGTTPLPTTRPGIVTTTTTTTSSGTPPSTVTTTTVTTTVLTKNASYFYRYPYYHRYWGPYRVWGDFYFYDNAGFWYYGPLSCWYIGGGYWWWHNRWYAPRWGYSLYWWQEKPAHRRVMILETTTNKLWFAVYKEEGDQLVLYEDARSLTKGARENLFLNRSTDEVIAIARNKKELKLSLPASGNERVRIIRMSDHDIKAPIASDLEHDQFKQQSAAKQAALADLEKRLQKVDPQKLPLGQEPLAPEEAQTDLQPPAPQ